MMLSRRLWSEAAALILVSKNKPSMDDFQPIQVGYKILMTKNIDTRTKILSNRLTFLQNSTDMADFNPYWANILQGAVARNPTLGHCTYDVSKRNLPVLCTSTYTGNYANHFPADSMMPPALGLRITAIRHTFGECGILLCCPTGSSDVVDATPWRSRVQEDPSSFLTMCEELQCCPDVWSLYEWSNWLTPSNKTWMQQRFDTLFFITIMDQIPEMHAHGTEIEKFQWIAPNEALESHKEGRIWLEAPYFYEMSKLEKIQGADQLESLTKKRDSQEIERWQSVYVVASDGVLNLLPGDDLYPESPDLTGDTPAKVLDKSIREISNETKRFNRIELPGLQNDRAVCNINSPQGPAL